MNKRLFALSLAAVIIFFGIGCQSGKKGDTPTTGRTFTLATSVGAHGKLSPDKGTFKEGMVVNLTAAPDTGYRLSYWTGTDNDASTTLTNSVTMTGDRTVEVGFISLIGEDFERSAADKEWKFNNGPEFPGAQGSFFVAGGAGRSGTKGGIVAFDFSGGGNYVIATRALASPVVIKGLSFWLAGYVPGTRILVRLTDETGQTFQYTPLVEATATAQWTEIRILLGDWDTSWGGAADGTFHGGAVACGIGIEKGLNYYSSGETDFDDVDEISSEDVSFDPFGADRLPDFYSGPIAPLLGVNIHFVKPDEGLLDMARQAGFGFVRMDLTWAAVERSAERYDFSEYDNLMAALEARGLGALFILDYANPLYYDGPDPFNDKWGPQSERTIAAYGAYAGEAARHFSGRDVKLEIWNEPNISQFWAPSPNPLDYGLLVNATYNAAKAAAPGVSLVVGATSGCDAAFIDRVYDTADPANADAISIHPYRDTPPETFIQDRALVKDVVYLKTGRNDVPLYSGEWGYSSVMFGGRTAGAWRKQAAYAARMILINLLSGVPRTVWYDLRDDGPDPANVEHNFGLLAENSAPKPAYRSVKALASLLPGRESGDQSVNSWALSAVKIRANGVFGLVFRNDRGRLAALWTSRKRGALEVKIPDLPDLEFFDMFGEKSASVRREGGFCYISLNGDDGPVYVKSRTAG